MPELGFHPVNSYLPPRPRRDLAGTGPMALPTALPPPRKDGDGEEEPGPLLRWLDRILSR